MIYLFYGADSDARRRAAENVLNRLTLEEEDFALFQMSDLDFDLEKIKEFAGAQDLFKKKLAIIVSDVLIQQETETALAEHLPAMAESPNIFIISERRPHADFLRTAKKLAYEAREFSMIGARRLPAGRHGEPFNNFSVSDAFGRRDRKGAWLSLTRALAAGAAGEELAGILFWQIKNMLLVKKSRPADGGAEQLGLKPFAFDKARDFAERFSESELEDSAASLVDLIHLSRRRGEDLLVGLELFLLKTL